MRKKQIEQNIQKVRDNYKKCNIYLMKYQNKKKEETEAILEAIITENFPKSISDTNSQFHENQRTPGRIRVKNFTYACHIQNAKSLKDKENFKEATRGKNTLTYR